MAEGQAEVKAEVINFSIVAQDGSDVKFKIKKSTKMEKVFQAYATKKAMDRKSIKFVIEGNILKGDITASDVCLEDGDEVQAMVEQIGGGAGGRVFRR